MPLRRSSLAGYTASANMILSYLDRSLEYRIASRAFVELVGSPPADIIGRSPREVHGPAAGDALTAVMAEVAEVRTFRTLRSDPDWSPLVPWHSADIAPEVDESGEVDGFWISYQLEQSRHLSGEPDGVEYHRGLFESAPDGIIVFRGGVAVLANPLAEMILGYRPGGINGLTPECLSRGTVDRDDGPELIEHALRTLPAGQVLRREWRAQRADGSRVDIEVSMSARNVAGVPEVLCHLRDVTDHVEAAARAVRSRAQMASIVDGALDGIVLIDSQGTILEVNPAALKMFGYASKEVLGAPLKHVIMLPEAIDGRDARVGALDRTGIGRLIGRRGEEVAVRKDGTAFPIELSAVRLETSGAPIFAGFVRDLTEAKRLEERYRRAQKMEAVARLTAGVAHDFNNLLTPILGYADMTITESTEEGPREFARMIRGAAGRGATLVERLLSFSSPSTEKFRTIDLARVVGELELLLKRLVGDQVTLVMDTAPEALVHGDSGQLEQVVMNLATNAADAMPHGGTLVVRVRADTADGGSVRLTVSDSGMGIAEDQMELIFDPFFTTKAEGKGTGLGLATVFWIVESHGGTVQVDSKPGQGTAFEISFQAVAGSVDESAVVAPRTFEARPGALALLVDDDPLVRSVARELLVEAGYAVTEASDAIEALELLEGMAHLDLAVTDFSMPGVNGNVLAAEVQRVRPEAVVLIMSGYAAAVEMDRPAGTIFLPKPFGRAGLAAALHEASG